MHNEIIVHPDGRLACGDAVYRCALGPNGVTGDKREGDGKTPAGAFPIRKVYYRADRLEVPETALPVEPLEPRHGWCTDPAHAEYNSLVLLPHAGMHEELVREDHIYDILCVLGYNDAPAVPGKGSAIFMHLARESYTPTEGCVALSLSDMRAVLRSVSKNAVVAIRQA